MGRRVRPVVAGAGHLKAIEKFIHFPPTFQLSPIFRSQNLHVPGCGAAAGWRGALTRQVPGTAQVPSTTSIAAAANWRRRAPACQPGGLDRPVGSATPARCAERGGVPGQEGGVAEEDVGLIKNTHPSALFRSLTSTAKRLADFEILAQRTPKSQDFGVRCAEGGIFFGEDK